jgi:integrase
MPALPTHLVKIGATYKFRARIPQDLLAHYAPKKEVMESLGTKSLPEARRRLPAVQLKYQEEWANLRAALRQDAGTEMPITDASIAYLSAVFAQESLGGDERMRLDGRYDLADIQEYREKLAETITLLRDAAAVGDLDVIRPALDQYLHLKRIRVTGSEDDHRRLALAYLRNAITTNAALLARMQGESVPTPALPGGPRPTATPAGIGGVTLYSLFEYWRDAVPNRQERTVSDFERRVRQLDDLTGHKRADQLTKADLVAFRDAQLAKGKSTSTVEKDLSFIKAILAYAHQSDRIPSNPAATVRVAQAKVSPNGRRELGPKDLETLFGSPIYTERARPAGGAGDAAYWLPLLGLYTGARLEELCQLRPDDIGERDGIPFLRIIDLEDEDRQVRTTVKTVESRREVPIHPALVQAGFLAYVQHVRTKKKDWLFPDLKPGAYGKRGANWSKWWGRWRTSLGIGGRAKCFHAFRHLFKTGSRDCEIPEDLHDALTGHVGGGIGRGYGAFSLKAKHQAIKKLRYAEFKSRIPVWAAGD